MEKDISNSTREEIINKYLNMKSFIITTKASVGMSYEHIKNHYNKEDIKDIVCKVDFDYNINIKIIKGTVYRNDQNKILMMESDDFIVEY